MTTDTDFMTALDIGILGTGAMAAALGRCWAIAGHRITIGGRSHSKAAALADRIGHGAAASDLRGAAEHRDVVLLAVPWDGVRSALDAVGATAGALAGTTLLDCTNAVEHGVGSLRPEIADSAAVRIAALAPDAHVVKGLNIFPAATWDASGADSGAGASIVALAGDDARSISRVARLVRDAAGVPVHIGALSRARQLEETAGFVIALAFAGHDPGAAVPRVG